MRTTKWLVVNRGKKNTSKLNRSTQVKVDYRLGGYSKFIPLILIEIFFSITVVNYLFFYFRVSSATYELCPQTKIICLFVL
jgi:hypothetical protein